MATRKSRDEDCCSVNFLKYVLHIFNVVFLLAGVVVLAVGIWTLVSKHQYTVLLTSASFPAAAIILVLAGCLALGVSVLGCCGVWREHRCLILMYTFMLLLIFLLEVLVGILAYIYQGYVKDELYQNLNSTFLESYSVDASRTAAIDRIQQEFKCCGAIRFEDWEGSHWRLGPPLKPSQSVPDSCCKTTSEGCGKRNHPSNIYYTGCIYKLADEVKEHLIILGAVGLGICVLQIFGMVLSCCLYIKLKDIID